MAYDVFLLVMSQLAGRRKARVVIQGEVVFFEVSDKKNRLIFSTKIFSGDGDLPPSVRSCVFSNGVLRWQQNGAFLKLDPNIHCVSLVQEVEMEKNKYLPFRRHLEDFCGIASEWREILRGFAEQDEMSVRRF